MFGVSFRGASKGVSRKGTPAFPSSMPRGSGKRQVQRKPISKKK